MEEVPEPAVEHPSAAEVRALPPCIAERPLYACFYLP